VRFLDDLLSLGNKFVEKLIYTHQVWGFSQGLSLKGIYPREYLQVISCEANHNAEFVNHFMNIKFHLSKDASTPCSQRLETSVYDKRDFDLKMLPPKTYVHIDSDAPSWCKENILYIQFLAQIELCSLSRIDDCNRECARIYHKMLVAGHSPDKLYLASYLEGS
jgi:hypothetical protein